mmetsp:Transcript_148098/g.369220  ORF Transcript_148098/g.369220 Transcript_148098/m.369220 type:complete len:283 (-) Transcript_148098:41-889(-)
MYEPHMMAEESIYAIVPPKVVVQPKPPMHKSKIPHDLPPTSSTFVRPGTTMPFVSNISGTHAQKAIGDRSHAEFGKPIGAYRNDPNTYMRKFAKSSSVPSLTEVKRTNPDQLKPSHLKESRFKGGGGPPKRGEQPVMNLVTSKNFIVANAVETILAQPKKIQDNTKDYLNKDDYGKVPKYLHHIKKDINAEYEYIRQLQEQQMQDEAPPVQPLDEGERLRLMDGLKSKWESINTAFQGETHLTVLDTMGKVRRKEKHEAELAQIEKDIERLNKANIAVDLSR